MARKCHFGWAKEHLAGLSFRFSQMLENLSQVLYVFTETIAVENNIVQVYKTCFPGKPLKT